MSELTTVSIDTRKHLVTIINQETETVVFADNKRLLGVYFISFEKQPIESDPQHWFTKCVLTVDKDRFLNNHKGFRIYFEEKQSHQLN